MGDGHSRNGGKVKTHLVLIVLVVIAYFVGAKFPGAADAVISKF